MNALQFYKEHVEGEPLTQDSVIWALDEYALNKKLDKNKIIEIVEGMGFELEFDEYDVPGKQWMTFTLKNKTLNEPDLIMIWHKEYTLLSNFSSLANIIFKAGQKLERLRINEYENICED